MSYVDVSILHPNLANVQRHTRNGTRATAPHLLFASVNFVDLSILHPNLANEQRRHPNGEAHTQNTTHRTCACQSALYATIFQFFKRPTASHAEKNTIFTQTCEFRSALYVPDPYLSNEPRRPQQEVASEERLHSLRTWDHDHRVHERFLWKVEASWRCPCPAAHTRC